MLQSIVRGIRRGIGELFVRPLTAASLVLLVTSGVAVMDTVRSVVVPILEPPLQVRDADRLYVAYLNLLRNHVVATPKYDLFARASEATSLQMAASVPFQTGFALAETRGVRIARAASINYFDVLGVQASKGRLWSAKADASTSTPLVVLSFDFWRSHWRSSDYLARSLTIRGVICQVIGVAEDGFHGVVGRSASAPAFWVFDPHGLVASLKETVEPLEILVRVPPENDAHQVSGQLAALQRIDSALGESEERVELIPALRVVIHPTIDEASKRTALAVSSLTLLLQFIIAIHLGCTLLTRTLARQKELIIKTALGARRSALLLEVISEYAAVFALGLGAGIFLGHALAAAALQQLPSLLPTVFAAPPQFDVGLQGVSSLIIAIGVSVCIIAILAGFALPHSITSGSVSDAAMGAVRPRRGIARAQYCLAASQIAVTFGLLVAVLGLAHTVYQGSRQDIGYDPSDTIYATCDLKVHGYTEPKATAFVGRFRESVGQLAANTRVGLSSWPNPTRDEQPTGFRPVGTLKAITRLANVYRVDPEVVELLRVRLLAGRLLRRGDRDVVLVSDRTASRHWPAGDAIGQEIALGLGQAHSNASKYPRFTVVGVVASLRSSSHDDNRDQLLVTFEDHPTTAFSIVARNSTEATSAEASNTIRRLVERTDPNVVVTDIHTLSSYVNRSVLPARAGAIITGSMAVVSVIVAMFGLFTCLEEYWARARRDVAIRLSLGASHARILSTILARGAAIVGTGVALGLALCLAGRSLLSPMFGSTLDLRVTIVCAMALVTATMSAAFVPTTVRALKADPWRILRNAE